jgi:hypothetical protein
MTCGQRDHRSLENEYRAQGKAIFQLVNRLQKAGITAPDNPAFESTAMSTAEAVPEAIECEGKSEGGNRKIKARFGRGHTHNEQMIMYPCGVVISRATFWGSEAVSGVNVGPSATHSCIFCRLTTPEICEGNISDCRVDARILHLRQ